MRMLFALLFAVLLATTAAAKELVFSACTADKQAVELTIDVADGAPASVAEHVKEALVNAAHDLTAGELQSREGFLKFVSYLSEDDLSAVAVNGPPVVVDGSCK